MPCIRAARIERSMLAMEERILYVHKVTDYTVTTQNSLQRIVVDTGNGNHSTGYTEIITVRTYRHMMIRRIGRTLVDNQTQYRITITIRAECIPINTRLRDRTILPEI